MGSSKEALYNSFLQSQYNYKDGSVLVIVAIPVLLYRPEIFVVNVFRGTRVPSALSRVSDGQGPGRRPPRSGTAAADQVHRDDLPLSTTTLWSPAAAAAISGQHQRRHH